MRSAISVLSNEELDRYSRHLLLPSFGAEGQLKLKSARVLVIGAGGLGSSVLQYLAAAGVGNIGIVDFDEVRSSNLQRQVLFSEHDLGSAKAYAAVGKLQALNSNIEVTPYHFRITSDNILELLALYDVVVDATDNFPVRYLINDACVLTGKPNVYGSISRYEGQVSVFNYTDGASARGPNYRDLFPTPPAEGMIEDCGEGGVLGALAGVIGSLQAIEVIKVITGIGEVLAGRLLTADLLHHRYMTFDFDCTAEGRNITSLIDYEEFCKPNNGNGEVRQLSASELHSMMSSGEEFLLIDLREPYEYALVNIGGQLISFDTLQQHPEHLHFTGNIVLHCKHGGRSERAAKELESRFSIKNLYSLQGGIIAYIHEFRPDLPSY